MTRDPLDLLRSADPVPQPIAYSEGDQARHIADILDRDGHRPLTVGRTMPGGPSTPRWLTTVIAAAAVVLLAVGLVVLVARRTGNDQSAGASPVTCTVSAGGGVQAVSGRLAQAEVVIGDRIDQLGGSARSFTASPTEASIGFAPHGMSVAKAARACRVSTVSVRPVIARAVDTRAPRSPDPLAALPFAVPSSEATYLRLTAVQRAQLASAMSHYDCSPLSSRATTGLTCTPSTDGVTQALLVVSPLLRGSDLRTVRATPPDTGSGGGSTAWTVQMSLRDAGAARLRAFTATHHTDDTAETVSTCGADAAVPCADFLAYTVNGHAESVPVTTAALQSETSISGAFTRATAQALAADITAAMIQLHPR